MRHLIDKRKTQIIEELQFLRTYLLFTLPKSIYLLIQFKDLEDDLVKQSYGIKV